MGVPCSKILNSIASAVSGMASLLLARSNRKVGQTFQAAFLIMRRLIVMPSRSTSYIGRFLYLLLGMPDLQGQQSLLRQYESLLVSHILTHTLISPTAD